ncbi:MAG TPA: hypothetical protein VHC47_07910, partial [Mucilaginibacter sp.]|nr:hypothetical protein [Mucilaginibacter sp.]
MRPDLVAKCTDKHLYDIRIVDEAGKFWAYSIQPRKDVGVPHFIDLPEVKRNTIADTNTVYIADAGTSTTLNELWLKLKNTDVTRQASLSGSDDMQHWFAIKENIELQGANEGTEPEYEQMLSFPASKYRYFRIEINNKNRDPIKIIQSGIYPASRKSPGFVISVPPPKLRVKNGHRQT